MRGVFADEVPLPGDRFCREPWRPNAVPSRTATETVVMQIRY